MGDPTTESSALGPALFIGLSLFVAVTQGEPEIIYANPVDLHPGEVLEPAYAAVKVAVPFALPRPNPLVLTTARPQADIPVPAALSVAPFAATDPTQRPAPLAPGLRAAPAPISADRPLRLTSAPTPAPGIAVLAQASPDTNRLTLGGTAPRTLPNIQAPRPAAQGVGPRPIRPDPPQSMPVRRRDPIRIVEQPTQPLVIQTSFARPKLPDPSLRSVPKQMSQPAVLMPVTAINSPRQIGELATPANQDTAAQSPKPTIIALTADRVYLRPTPDLSSQTLAQFDQGTQVQVFGRWGKWARVRIATPQATLEGWMWDTYLPSAPPE